MSGDPNPSLDRINGHISKRTNESDPGDHSKNKSGSENKEEKIDSPKPSSPDDPSKSDKTAVPEEGGTSKEGQKEDKSKKKQGQGWKNQIKALAKYNQYYIQIKGTIC